MELWCLLLALVVSLRLLCSVTGKLPWHLGNISADVMKVKTASDKVSDMKSRSYLNLKETERDESSKWLTNTCPTGALHAFYLAILLTGKDGFDRFFHCCYNKTEYAFYIDITLTPQKVLWFKCWSDSKLTKHDHKNNSFFWCYLFSTGCKLYQT